MKWVEIIHIRSNSDPTLDRIRGAFHELEHTQKPSFLQGFQLFQNLMVGGDLAIFLYWSNDAPPEGISILGRSLATFFSEFGWINHVSWTVDESTREQ